MIARPKPSLPALLLPSLLCLGLAANPARAEEPPRLSSVLTQAPSPRQADDYLPGASWQVPAEVPAQLRARLQLQNALADHPALSQWIAGLPVTGRVPIALADARWLEANPTRDPRLEAGHRVVLPPRPATVTVVRADGSRCQVRHTPGGHAPDYLRACHPTPASLIDWVWIAQPDGITRRYGNAPWNEEAQEEPAPGAWIFGPTREDKIAPDTGNALIAFLATQGPALDADQTARQIYPAGAPAPSPAAPASAPLPAPAPEAIAPHSLMLTAGDWGSIGLMQTPTARNAPEGDVRLVTSRVAPYTRINVFAQPLPWLEAGFRYTAVSNRRYGVEGFSGDQSYKDKSLDVKFQLLQEHALQPALAVGFRDITGTGLFSGEYLVASKRFGLSDVSAGINWGYGSGNGFKNPLSFLRPKLEKRDNATIESGKFSASNFFAGNATLFGGVAIQVPDQPLVLKIEYDGNDYQTEPQANNQPQRSHLNLGLTWRALRGMDVSVGLERGNTLMVALNFHTELNRLSVGKYSDPKPVRITPPQGPGTQDWATTLADIRERTEWRAGKIEQRDRELRLTLTDAEATYWRDRVDAASAVLNRDAGMDIDQFTFAYAPNGVEVGEHVVDRDLWLAQKTRPLTPSEMTAPIFARPPQAAGEARLLLHEPRPFFESGLGLNLQQSVGGPDGFALYQLVATWHARANFTDSTWAQSSVEFGLLDNYDKFRYTAPSQLPRVRTYAREFVTTSNVRLANLQATHLAQAGKDHFFSVYGGYLESMYAGVGGEWLYRPFAGKVAFGVDVNAVQQRDFAQDLALRDYRVTTGHATLYWDTGWKDVQFNLSAGKYLAGDLGATFEVSRGFDNGVRMGAYFTKTNVSSAQFGEGSFDKGIYISVPFDAFLTKTSKDTAWFNWRPLTRDGGAKLNRAVSLYDLTRVRDSRALHYAAAPLPNHEVAPADHRVAPLAAAAERDAPATVTARPQTASMSDPVFERRLTAALNFHDFHYVRIDTRQQGLIDITATSDRIRPFSRAANRAALIALRSAPTDTRSIHVSFEENGHAVLRYEFFDLDKLDDFYSGLIDEAALKPYIGVRVLDANYADQDPLDRFDDERREADGPNLSTVMAPVTRPIERVGRDFLAAGSLARHIDYTHTALVAGGLILAGRALDNRADRFAQQHSDNALLNRAATVGNALPLLMTGAAAAHALLSHHPTQQRVAWSATEASVSALIGGSLIKRVIHRDRPGVKGSKDADAHRSFPSNHAAVAWAVVTPYALEYRAPWLYGAPLLTQFARVQDRKHWLSDTVAGAVLGYSLGKLFYQSGVNSAQHPRLWATTEEIGLSWPF